MPRGYQTSEDFQTEEKLAIFLAESVRPDFQQIQKYMSIKTQIEELENRPLCHWINKGISMLPKDDQEKIARAKRSSEIAELKQQIGEE